MAANVVKRLPFSVTIDTIDADWDWGVSGNSEDVNPRINSITFVPGDDTDYLTVRDGSLTGPIIFYALALNTDEKVQYYHGALIWPVIEFSEIVVAGGTHYVLFEFWPHRR